jgi:hypothetical protein
MNPKLNLTLPDNLKEEIIIFALNEENLSLFTPNGEGRRYCNLNNHILDLTTKVQNFAAQCYSSLGINYITEEPRFGNFIGVNDENAFVHEHTDTVNENGDWHIRINFLVQKPTEGGTPHINQNPVNLNEGDSWINFANVWTHSSMPVVGERKRIVLSLGNYVKDSDALNLFEVYK